MLKLCRFSNLVLKTQRGSDYFRTSHVKALQNVRPLSTTQISLKESPNGEMIYNGPLRSQIRAVKFFSLTTSIGGLVAQPIVVQEANKLGSTGLLVAMCSVVGFFTFVTPVLLHFITKKYVLELEYEPKTETFTATTMTFLCREKETKFKAEDVYVPDVPGMFTSFHAKGIPMFVEARHFTDVKLYAKLMGFDKPMDFKLGEQDEDEDEEKIVDKKSR